MNSNGTMFGMCNPEAAGVYGHHHHHQSQHYSSSPSDLGSPGGYPGSGGGNPVSESPNSGGGVGHPYGLQAAAAAAAVAAAASPNIASTTTEANSNNNRSNSVEASSAGQNSPTTTGIISESNGLQYANLDGSGGPGGAHPPGSGYGGYGGHHMGYPQYSDIHGDGLSSVAAAAAAASGGHGGFSSAYLDNSAAAAAVYSQYPSIYGQHHPHSLSKIRGHDFGGSNYPNAADFASAAAAVSKPAQPAVPTYKWMQVKRNVPKPGEENKSILKLNLSKN